MAIQFPCPQCEKILSAAEDAVGQSVTCGQCGKVTYVPDPALVPDSTALDTFPPQEQRNLSCEHAPSVSLRQIESQTGLAILVTLCFMPLAIIGMIYGSMAKAEFLGGNYSTAKRYYRRAHLWTILSLVLWAIIFFTAIFTVIKNLP